MGRWSEAGERFRHLLKMDPKHAGGLDGLAQALRHQAQPAEALFVRRAVRLTDSQNTGILLTLTEVYADLGRFAEAEDAAGRAMELAERREPNRLLSSAFAGTRRSLVPEPGATMNGSCGTPDNQRVKSGDVWPSRREIPKCVLTRCRESFRGVSAAPG